MQEFFLKYASGVPNLSQSSQRAQRRSKPFIRRLRRLREFSGYRRGEQEQNLFLDTDYADYTVFPATPGKPET
jgi:hypothetical protein